MKRSVHVPTFTRAEFAEIVGSSGVALARLGPDSPLRQLNKPRAPRRTDEHDGQVEYFRAIVPDLQRRYPDHAHLFELTYANPNWVGLGKSTINAGKELKAEGKKAGIPDLTHPVARFGYHGLYVENKIGRTVLSDEQMDWAHLLHRQGYAVVVCRGETPSTLANAIGRVIGGYTLWDHRWYDHIDPKEAWL